MIAEDESRTHLVTSTPSTIENSTASCSPLCGSVRGVDGMHVAKLIQRWHDFYGFLDDKSLLFEGVQHVLLI